MGPLQSATAILDLHYANLSVLGTGQDFFELATGYLDRARQCNVLRAEIFFDPQTHVSNGVRLEAVMEGLTAAIRDSDRTHGISSDLIMCFLRDRGAEAADEMLSAILPFRADIVGVGLDSTEIGCPPELFADVYARAAAEDLHLVAHAGEEGGPETVAAALDVLHVERVDHGIRAMEDPAVVKRLRGQRVPLTVCPLSNVCLRVVGTLADHPLPVMLEEGLLVTINSDDPPYFGGYVDANYAAIREQCAITPGQLETPALNSFDASFIDDSRRQAWKQQVRAAFAPRTDNARPSIVGGGNSGGHGRRPGSLITVTGCDRGGVRLDWRSAIHQGSRGDQCPWGRGGSTQEWLICALPTIPAFGEPAARIRQGSGATPDPRSDHARHLMRRICRVVRSASSSWSCPRVQDTRQAGQPGRSASHSASAPVAGLQARAPGCPRRGPGRTLAFVTGQSAMAVEPAHPPAAMMRVSNPVMRGLLRSPAGGPLRKQFMVLRFFGRKTGRRYDVPVVAHRLDSGLYALTDAPWRNNFRDGADVEVTLDGHVTRMRGHLVDDPEAVASLYARAIDHFGAKRAQRMLGLKIHTTGTPATEALAEAARRYHLSAIQLTVNT